MTDTNRADGRALRWRGQHERRRAEFVDAAIAAIAAHGADVSTERIATRAGVARTRLYKHFQDSADLHCAVAARVRDMITEELRPVFSPKGTPMEMISTAVGTHLNWLIEHHELYRYLLQHPRPSQQQSADQALDVKTAIGLQLGELLHSYLDILGLDPSPAETTAFGIVGYVESATTRWLDAPGELGREALVEQLTRAIWAVLDSSLRADGVELDPHEPLPSLAEH